MDKRRRTSKTGAATTPRSDPQGRQFEELDVTVDTGSTYTAVPREMLQRLGVPVERSLPSETADGRIVPVDVGEATIRLEVQFHTPVIFAEENEPSLLGVVSLEQAALAVDPLVSQRRIYDGTLAAGPFPSQMYVVQMSQQYLRHEAFPKQHVKPSL